MGDMSRPSSDHADIIFLRHGHAHLENAEDRYFTNHATPLTGLGRYQAEVAAELLVPSGIDRIVASDMARAAETASIVARRLSLRPNFHPELREVDCGHTDGCTEMELRERFPDHTGLLEVGFLGGFPTGTNHVPADLPFPGGESIGQVAERAIPFFSALCRDTIGTTTLVVAHAWVLTTLLCHLVEAPISSYYRFYLDNIGISRLRADRHGRGILHGVNVWPWEAAATLVGMAAPTAGDPLAAGSRLGNATGLSS
jgi:probable phosphoglycerate mutase